MVSCSIFGREMTLQGSPVTLVEYQREFSCDLMQDLVKAYSQGFINSAIMLQIAWAMARTHEKTTPAFEEWLKEFDTENFNLLNADFLEVVDSAINAELFCGSASKQHKIRKWFKRLLERISKHFDALRIGFNYEDLRHMTMREFIAYTDLAFTSDGETQTKTASQKDIDAFLA